MTYSPASAAIIMTTYKGTVTDGEDTTGVFGTAGASLAGRSFSAVYTMDLAINSYRTTVPGISDYVFGQGATSPLISATYTIGGATYNFTGLSADAYVEGGLIARSGAWAKVNGPGTLVDDLLIMQLPSGATPASLDTSFDLTGWGLGQLSLSHYDIQQQQFDALAWAEIKLTSAYTGSGSGVSPVPEPATWAMMIVGFGLVGSTLRASRVRRLAA